MIGTHGNDSGRRSVHANIMDMNLAVLAERSNYRKSGSERATKRVDEYIDRLALILGKDIVNVRCVEVITSYKAFEF
jgi:hypothetical protein